MLPNCFVIGAPRSGTTSLYEYLNAHPDVYMSPVKEPDFFCRASLDAAHLAPAGNAATPVEDAQCQAALKADFDQYLPLFDGASGQKIRGEASAIYLAHPTAALHLRRYVPDAKLIAILRDPSERLHSHYVHTARIHADAGSTEDTSSKLMKEVIQVVDRAHNEGFHGPANTDAEVWLNSGFYFRHLTRFQSIFPKEQLRIFCFEDLTRDPNSLMKEIFGFLEIDDTFVLPTTAAFNASVVPRNRGVFRFFTTQNPIMRFARSIAPSKLRAAAMQTRNRVLDSGKPTLDPELRRKLVCIYREDITQLQTLLGRDLSAWLEHA